MVEIVEIDPADLLLPPPRRSGADPAKLSRQIALYGNSLDGMPPLLAYRFSDGKLMLFDGVTRATRAAMLQPGATVRVEIVGDLPRRAPKGPTVRDKLP
jgi:hypothetical protein